MGEAVETRTAKIKFHTSVTASRADFDEDVFAEGSIEVDWTLSLLLTESGIKTAVVFVHAINGDIVLKPWGSGAKLGPPTRHVISYESGGDLPGIDLQAVLDVDPKEYAMMDRSWTVKADFNPQHVNLQSCEISNLKVDFGAATITVEF